MFRAGADRWVLRALRSADHYAWTTFSCCRSCAGWSRVSDSLISWPAHIPDSPCDCLIGSVVLSTSLFTWEAACGYNPPRACSIPLVSGFITEVTEGERASGPANDG
ncbi:hypothetical protein Y032_0051g2109 [Ancylostoma ceylanicum]|uniref:Uncharacterized protein n=1 Tax=Ancylostoma ceylanicum TaxID=53326 RepID=A0A016U9H4_9BILA|nr:hypothetical protein Y032_0051g2109 [Ancylostoma ceylanicum]